MNKLSLNSVVIKIVINGSDHSTKLDKKYKLKTQKLIHLMMKTPTIKTMTWVVKMASSLLSKNNKYKKEF